MAAEVGPSKFVWRFFLCLQTYSVSMAEAAILAVWSITCTACHTKWIVTCRPTITQFESSLFACHAHQSWG